MSQPDSTEIRVGFLSYINVYTVMLGLSLLAVLLAIALLAIELTRFGWDTDARTASRAATQPARSIVLNAPSLRA